LHPVRRFRHYARDSAVLFYKINHLSLHHELETGIAARLLDNEIQEVPLRHERQKFAMRWQVPEIGNGHRLFAYLSGKLKNFLMRTLQEIFQNAQLIHELKR